LARQLELSDKMDSRKNTSQIPQKNSDRRKKHYQYKKAQLPQKDHVTLYVSKFVLCFTSYESYKGFKLQKGSLRSPKGAGKLAMVPFDIPHTISY